MLESKSDEQALCVQCRCLPLVIVEGFLGKTGSIIWGGFERYLNQDCPSQRCERRVIFTSVGPVSSLHDRACELYYSLVGGTVDYGAEHSVVHGHSRYGRTHSQGLYPQWSCGSPLHFLGHSIGGPTIIKLQYLLKQGLFGARVHSDSIRSVNTISSPFRGTQAVYTLGERADAAPLVRPFSLGSMIAKGVHMISYLSPLLPRALDLHTESRCMTFRDITMLSLCKQLWKSEWAESRDATPYDVTFEAADEREANGEGEIHPKTFYRSCATYMTRKVEGESNFHSVSLSRSLSMSAAFPFMFMARAIGSFDFSAVRPVPSFLFSEKSCADVELGLSAHRKELPEEFWGNDGVVPLISQWHPLNCSSTQCQHTEMKGLPKPGVWYVDQWDNASHVSIVPLWTSSSLQKNYWIDLGRWLRAVDLKDVSKLYAIPTNAVLCSKLDDLDRKACGRK